MGNAGAGSKVDAVVKLALISFVVILSFAVGTFVGKQVSDADHRRAELENDYQSESEVRSVASTEDTVPGAQSITDQEIAALKEEFERAEAKTATTNADTTAAAAATATAATDKTTETSKDGYKKLGANEAQNDTTTATVKTATTTKMTDTKATSAKATDTKVQPAAERVAKALAPAQDMKVPKTPDTNLPGVATTAIGKFTVQVASYATETEAKDQVTKLKTKGFSAFYVTADVKGQTWYRVSVGLFPDQNSAMDYRKEILGSRAVTSAIVQKIVK